MIEQPIPDAILEKVGPERLMDCGIGCLTNPKHEGYEPKVEWLQKRFAEGLRFLLFRDGKGKPLAKYQGLNIVYSAQCPMLPKSVNDLSQMASEHGLELKVTVLNSAQEAQNAPSYYGVFNLVWNGRLLADHYVSKGRFKSILKKEILDQKG